MDEQTATIVAAFVGVASAILTAILKDFVFVRWHRRLDKNSDNQDIIRLYRGPLVAASEKLVWRFSEIFIARRYQFLKTATLPLVFNEYKRQSTLYRIAVLLGWMRAIQLELNALSPSAVVPSNTIGPALEAVRRALADGPQVELLRLRKLAEVWDLGPIAASQEVDLAAELERRLYSEAGNELKHDARYLFQLDRDNKARVCRALSDFLCLKLNKRKLSDAFLGERIEAAIIRMSYREALIYRDWQDAIGDRMLVRDEDSERRFVTIGFSQFVDLLGEDSLWMEVFRDSIVDIDFEEVDVTDYRATQLSDLSKAVADIIIAVDKGSDRDLVSSDVLNEARRLSELHTSSAHGAR